MKRRLRHMKIGSQSPGPAPSPDNHPGVAGYNFTPTSPADHRRIGTTRIGGFTGRFRGVTSLLCAVFLDICGYMLVYECKYQDELADIGHWVCLILSLSPAP
ncbi:hypothetical protein K456DRAFT_51861 [Colletotrichum gloeosporioides 23]|nr:hypothetical protein K456DRAFT_51861 [Colletotrichum gloeosporioides 23]